MNNNIEKEQNNLFSTIEKKFTEWVVHERNEKMSNVLISTQNYCILKRVKMLQWGS